MDVKDALPVELGVIEAVDDSVVAVEGVLGALSVPETDPAAVPLLPKLLLGFPVPDEKGDREGVEDRVSVWEASGEKEVPLECDAVELATALCVPPGLFTEGVPM